MERPHWNALDAKRRGRIAVGAGGILLSGGYIVEATRLPFGTMASPSAGPFPVAIGVLGLAMSVLVVLEATFTDQVSGEVTLPRGDELRDTLGFVVPTVILVPLLPILGMLVASMLYCTTVVKLVGRVGVIRSALVGCVVAYLITYLFTEQLFVSLPKGTLFR